MTKRPVGTTHRPSRRKWRWPRSRARRRWPNWRSSSMSIRTRSRNGRVSCSKARPAFSGAAGIEAAAPPVDLKALHAKIGELALENDFLDGALSKAGLLSAKR